MEEAIENLGVEKRKLIIEEQALSELKSEMADYQEDIEDFRKVRSFANHKVCQFSLHPGTSTVEGTRGRAVVMGKREGRGVVVNVFLPNKDVMVHCLQNTEIRCALDFILFV